MTTVGTAGRHLNPDPRVPVFRVPVPKIAQWVRYVWVIGWTLPAGEVLSQRVLSSPGCQLSVEPDGVFLTGPGTKESWKFLVASGWVVGVALTGTGVAGLHRWAQTAHDVTLPPAWQVTDAKTAVPQGEWAAQVRTWFGPGTAAYDQEPSLPDIENASLADSATPVATAQLADQVAAALTAWIAQWVPGPDCRGELADAFLDLVAAGQRGNVPDFAQQLHISTRTLDRAVRATVGLPPAAIIRRKRLQDSLSRIAQGPTETLAAIAAELGYTDHAHLHREIYATFGKTPTELRAEFN